MHNNFKRYTVTTALPYANGPVHIGHLAGVYVPADIYVRFLRMNGEDVIFIGGSDEHGVPITLRAKKEGVTPQDIVDRYHSIIKKSFKDFGISFDIYSRTSSEIHHKTASEFFKKLNSEGKLKVKLDQQFYDEEANQFLADRYVTGECPHCHFEKAYGDQCENCGTSLNATDLINPKSVITGNVPIMKETEHWYLLLDEYENWLKEWILEGHKEWKVNVYGQCKSWLDSGLHPRAVTRDLDWGVKVPVENVEGKVLYVWFDAPIGYISATKELTDDWEKYWKDPETRLIHFIGKDNIVFHCIIFPSMLKAEGSYILPDNVPAFEFLNLEGDKISTSNNWAVWLHEYLEEFPNKQDVLRYVLTANAPETKDSEFTWKDYQTKNNSELLSIFGNFINRTLVLTHKYFHGIVPERHELSDLDKSVLEELSKIPQQISKDFEKFSFREALAHMMNMARLGNKYLTDTEPWKVFKQDTQRVGTILNIALQICANLSIVSYPFLPFTAEKIREMLKIKYEKWQDAGKEDLIKAGHNLGEPVLLFEKVEDSVVEWQLNKLKETKKRNLENIIESKKLPPILPEIDFDDFTKIDLRTAVILDAVKVPKTDKLLKLLVDTGIDKRTIVSGIAEYYKPEEIIGKHVCIVANLAPRKLRGIESKGMILMAEDKSGKLCFVSPTEDFNVGSTVR
ncbi:MAG: methionine--tRNA ligase [Bacteroidales bacterium]|jgi:methionyl-tRNA synthetase